MRTTIDLPDHLLVEAKKLAADRHLPLTRLVEESVRAYLADQRLQGRGDEPRELPVLEEPVPLVDLDDTSRLWEIEVPVSPVRLEDPRPSSQLQVLAEKIVEGTPGTDMPVLKALGRERSTRWSSPVPTP